MFVEFCFQSSFCHPAPKFGSRVETIVFSASNGTLPKKVSININSKIFLFENS